MVVYLDYNATTPLDPRVLDVMVDVYRNSPGNADSRTHLFGDSTRKIVESARGQVAKLLDVEPAEVIFTSGATESINIALQGLVEYGRKVNKKHIVTTSIEHKAVLETVRYLADNGFEIDLVNPDHSGRVHAEDILEKVRPDTLLVSMIHVNNETGVIQPVDLVGKKLKKQGAFFHVDATQSCGKLVDDLQNLNYDLMSFSGHKFGGPQGIGALILRQTNYVYPPVKNITFGGQQEHGLRPGTIPVALTAGLGEASRLALLEWKERECRNTELKQQILDVLNRSGVSYQINGSLESGMSNTLNICFDQVSSEALMVLTKQSVAISNGSACTSHNYSPSYVLTAMGLEPDRIESSIRLSWGSSSNPDQVLEGINTLLNTVKSLA